jgi:hypothetical protein
MTAEYSGDLKQAGSVVLDGSGNGTISFSAQNARQRWEVTAIVVSTSQAATATPVPVATVYVNGVSTGNSQGATSSGNQDTFSGTVQVGPCDTLSVVFAGGIAGTTAFANVAGTKYTRRA